MVKIINNFNEIYTIAQIWHQLECNSSIRIFQTYLWCTSAWQNILSKEGGNRLFIIYWTQGDCDDSIIFPTYIDKRGTLRYILDNSCDVCDALYKRGVNHHIAYKEIGDAILSSGCVKNVWLQKMIGDSEVLNNFGVLLRGCFIGRDNAFSWIKCDPTIDFIVSQTHLKSKDRANLKALRRNTDGCVVKVCSKLNNDEFPLNELIELRTLMRSRGWRANDYFPDSQVAFTRQLYDGNGCDVALLYKGEKLQGLNVFLKSGPRLLSWVFLYADARASTALYVNFLNNNKMHEKFIFDFGVGVYSYKIGTFRPHLEITHSLRYGLGIAIQIRNLVAMNLRFIKDYLKVCMKKYGK